MNNAKLILKKGISKKTNQEYTYLSIQVKDIEIAKIFIKPTEIPYYTDLLK